MADRTTEPDQDDLPVGTPVLAFPGSREGRAILTRTRSVVWSVGGTPCLQVEGYPGGIALTHVEVIPPPARTGHVTGVDPYGLAGSA